MSVKTERIAIRKLIKSLKYHAQNNFCEKDCDCDDCKAIRYGLKEVKKLTYIIDTNKRARALCGL
jgi:hypothetical protein